MHDILGADIMEEFDGVTKYVQKRDARKEK